MNVPKILIVNSKGSAGGTTVGRHAILPSMPANTKVLAVDLLNEVIPGAERISMSDLEARLFAYRELPCLVDVGSVDYQNLIDVADDTRGNLFRDITGVVTITNWDREEETLRCINDLLLHGISAEKIIIVPNRLPRGRLNFDTACPRVKARADALEIPISFVIPESDVFAMAKKTPYSVADIASLDMPSDVYWTHRNSLESFEERAALDLRKVITEKFVGAEKLMSAIGGWIVSAANVNHA